MIPTSSSFAFDDISKKEEKRNLIVKKKGKRNSKNMRKSVKGCFTVITFLCAAILITAGVVMMNNQTLSNYLLKRIRLVCKDICDRKKKKVIKKLMKKSLILFVLS